MAKVTNNDRRTGTKRRGRLLRWSLILFVLGFLVVPFAAYVYVGISPAEAAAEDQSNPRANYWRAVREGVSGYSAVSGQETNVLIQNGGQNWRQVRNGPLATYGAWILALVVLAIGAFHVIFGTSKLEGRSGVKVLRWTAFDRIMHWFVAILFIILALTGLSLLYGRAILIPVMGKEGFAAWANVAKPIHDYLSPLFIAGLAVMLLVWMRESFFTKVDWEWFKKGGGYFGGGHASAGKVNAGEKVWFWALFFLGIVLCVSGFIMLFPNYGFERDTMQLSTLLHAASGVLLIAFSLGHIYLGTLGNEGTFEGMIGGEVDAEWAKQHHDVWYEEVTSGGGAEHSADAPGGSPTAAST